MMMLSNGVRPRAFVLAVPSVAAVDAGGAAEVAVLGCDNVNLRVSLFYCWIRR